MGKFSMIKWFRNISIAKKLYFTVGVMALLIAIELVTLWFAITTLSAVRAYVGGEGLWSKAQKDAIYCLEKFARTKDQKDFAKFENFMKVPLGDHKARVELIKTNPDLNIVRQGFLEGRNHPDDIDGMIKLFKRFHGISYINRAIAIWTEADPISAQLISIGQRIQVEIMLGDNNTHEILKEIEPINQQLTKLEDDFSYTLGEGSRWLENLILTLLFTVALSVEISGLLLAISISRGMHKGLNDIIRVATITAQGDFTARAHVYSQDEIGTLAGSFNYMIRELDKKTKQRKEAEELLESKIAYIKNNEERISAIMEILLNYSLMDFSQKAAVSEKGDELDAIAAGLNVLSEELQFHIEELKQSQMQLAAAQHIAHIGSWEWDLAKDSLHWSDELYRIYGMDPLKKDITPKKVFEKVHKADIDHIGSVIAESKKTLRPFSFYYRIVLDDKTVRTIHTRGKVITNPAGEPIRIVGTDQDVSERMNEEKLEKLAMAATQSYNSVIIANQAGRIEWVNDGFTKLTGYTLKDVQDSHGELLRKGSQTGLSQETDFYASVLKEKKPITYECKNYTKSGKEYWVITTLTPVLGNDGEVEKIIAIDSDITQRKQIEQDLIQANRIAEHSLMKGNKALDELTKAKKELELSMKAKEQFLANMSHEIRTPMNAIVGFTDLILKTPLTAEQKQFLDAIKTSGENLIVIINDILDISKIQSGKIVLEQIDFRLSQIMALVTEMMLPKSIEKNIKLSTIIDKRIPDDLIGDPTRLNQILLNLVGNAIKFTETGEVRTVVRLISDNDEHATLSFSVADTGIGIPEEKLSTIFDAFTQATNETTRKFGGSGLGLTIVKQLVEIQGGKVSVCSKIGEGSTFTFQLVFKKNHHPNPAKENKDLKNADAYPLQELSILLVEDNLLNQVLAKKVLTDWNWKVEVADNGNMAIEKLKKQNFDIILMDIQLPEMDGYEATQYIRKKFDAPKCNTPIMAMTAHAMSSEEEKCKKMGMDGYISKPFDQKVLFSKILALAKKNGSSEKEPSLKNDTPQKKTIMQYTNLSYLEQLANGSNEFMKEMITLFIKQTPEALDKIKIHLENKEWKLLRGILHKIKPSIAFVGLKEIEEVVKQAEEYAADETNLDQLPGLIDKIKHHCDCAVKELHQKLKDIP